MLKARWILLALVAGSLASGQTYTIRTAAGSGLWGFTGDGGPATAARLSYPTGVAADTLGNLYIADSANHRIRKVSATGVITTVAGTGTAGFGGDGGIAINAQLNSPAGLALDGGGNLYVADSFNHRIRLVTPLGGISTIAGIGTSGFSGDGGPASGAQLSYPLGVAADNAGNVYVADYFNHRVRRISSAGVITTVAGSGVAGFSGDGGPATSAQLSGPYAVAVGATGNVFIVDLNNNRVRRVSTAGVITTVAGSGQAGFGGDFGPATSAKLYNPTGVSVDSTGNLYIADSFNNVIRRVSPAGVITTIAGDGSFGFNGDNGAATGAQFRIPYAVAGDSAGRLFIADQNNHRVRVLTPDPVTCLVTLNPSPVTLPKGSGSLSVNVTRDASCGTWTATSNQAWLTIPGGGTGTGNGALQISFTANPGNTVRTATLTIVDQTFGVAQEAAASCALTVSSAGMTTSPAEGRTGQFGVTLTGGTCAWAVRSSQPWLQLFPLSGSTSGTVGFTVFPNFGTQQRVANVTIGDVVVTVTQTAMAGGADVRFVRRAYFNVLRRVPSAEDEAFHVASLATRSRAEVTQSFLEGDEFRAGGAFVTALYRVLLGRVPEIGGWAFQLNSVVQFRTAQPVLAGAFLDAPEWRLKQGASITDEQFVRLLFQEVNGRQPSAEELAFQLKNAGNRGQLATSFLGTPEFWARNGPLLNALHAFFVILGRDPTPSELTALEARLRAGTTFAAIIVEFVNSTEHAAALQ